LAVVLAGCAPSETSDAETLPSAVLESDESTDSTGAMFRHCSAQHRDPTTDNVTCAGYEIEVKKRDDTSFEPVLDAYIQTNVYARTSKSDAFETKISMYQLQVGEDRWPGRSFWLKPRMTTGSAEVGFIVVGQGVGGQTLSITCGGKLIADREANLDSDCKAAMAYIMTAGIPGRLFEVVK
jgi:hypothetical protein